MYISSHFSSNDVNEAFSFMKQYSFATIITSKSNIPTASHLPFTVSKRDDQFRLSSHFAKANPQWKDIAGHQCLIIFSEPHAYISPEHYENKQSVPTWNYVAVHAYGSGKIIEDKIQAYGVLENMIDTYDEAYKAQWNQLSEDYKSKMLNGIVTFEITINDLQVSRKLSQNRSRGDQERIIEALSASNDSGEQTIADYMKAGLN